jgi:hypothetical protein
MRTKEEILNWLAWNNSELNELDRGTIQAESYIGARQYYKGVINTLKWVLNESEE